MELITISEYDLRDYIYASYEGDADLLLKYHVGDFSLNEAVDETLRMIQITAPTVNMNYYGLEEDGEKIGYLCTFTHNLYSFGLNITKRTKENLIDMWGKIKEVMNGNFITMLYPNNTRAIEWVKKCGMDEVIGVEDNCTVLIYVNNNNN